MCKKWLCFMLCIGVVFACGCLTASAEETKYMITDTYSPWPSIGILGYNGSTDGYVVVEYEEGIAAPGFATAASIVGNNPWETGAYFGSSYVTDADRASCVLRLNMPPVSETAYTTYLRFTIWVYQPYKLNSLMQYPLDQLTDVYITKADGTKIELTDYTTCLAVGMTGSYGGLPAIEGYNKWDAWTGYTYEYETTEKFEGDFSIGYVLQTSSFIDSTEGKKAHFGMSPVQIQQWTTGDLLIVDKLDEQTNTIGGFFSSLGDRISGFFDNLISEVIGFFKSVGSFFKSVAVGITGFFKDLVAFCTTIVAVQAFYVSLIGQLPPIITTILIAVMVVTVLYLILGRQTG